MTTIEDSKTIPKIKPKTGLVEPSKYNVIFMNDEVTTGDFVVETLVLVFNYSHVDAELMTETIHNEGSGVVATMPYEIAEQKTVEVTLLARNHGFPLLVKLEPET